MRALVALLCLVSAMPLAAADHEGCTFDGWAGPLHVECYSHEHHDGVMYEKRVEIDSDELDLGLPMDVFVGVEHKYSTAASASTCRVYVNAPMRTSVGTPCAGAHNALLP